MDIKHNTEAMPTTPRSMNGYWEWDANTTAKHRSPDGQEWLLKGAWRWRQAAQKQDAFTKNASVKQIVKFHKPAKVLRNDFKIEKFLNTFVFIAAGILVVSILALLIAL